MGSAEEPLWGARKSLEKNRIFGSKKDVIISYNNNNMSSIHKPIRIFQCCVCCIHFCRVRVHLVSTNSRPFEPIRTSTLKIWWSLSKRSTRWGRSSRHRSPIASGESRRESGRRGKPSGDVPPDRAVERGNQGKRYPNDRGLLWIVPNTRDTFFHT